MCSASVYLSRFCGSSPFCFGAESRASTTEPNNGLWLSSNNTLAVFLLTRDVDLPLPVAMPFLLSFVQFAVSRLDLDQLVLLEVMSAIWARHLATNQ